MSHLPAASDLSSIHLDKGELLVRTIAMPSDTNPAGDIFGGWLMAQMDLAAGNLAAKVARGRCGTIAVEAMKFIRPVKVGDEVSIYAKLLGTGNTSMTIQLKAFRRRRDQSMSEAVTEAKFIFVGLNEDGSKRAIPI